MKLTIPYYLHKAGNAVLHIVSFPIDMPSRIQLGMQKNPRIQEKVMVYVFLYILVESLLVSRNSGDL